jgi:DNA-binding XRE family transcriptional regulator
MAASKKFSGRRLRELREEAGYSREQVAVAISRTWHSIYQFERDELKPGREAQEALADLLGVRMDDFYVEVVDA